MRHDILQLQGLTSRIDSEAFLPIRADEVTNQEIARRLVNYSGLIADITQKLKDSGVADTNQLRTSHGYYTTGRYLRVHGSLACGSGSSSKYGAMPGSRLCGRCSTTVSSPASPVTIRRSADSSMMRNSMQMMGACTFRSASRPASNGTGS